jgi:hypothetical protein
MAEDDIPRIAELAVAGGRGRGRVIATPARSSVMGWSPCCARHGPVRRRTPCGARRREGVVSMADQLYGATVGTALEPESVLLPGHDVPLGRYTTVRRLLPQRQRRMVGAWCFVDHFGPEDVSARPGMQVPPHPHTGLQTVTWLVDGEIVHRDSLGSDQPIRPGSSTS